MELNTEVEKESISYSQEDIEIKKRLVEIKTNKLTNIKKKIENMNNINHTELLYIFSRNNSIQYNENSNGTFINLTDLDNDIIDKLEEFINYVNKQNIEINDIEHKKLSLENIFFKQNKE
tara:strand:+ start:80 stop:439 length:360 start_codon:yes stop_codon:yes gene_type:complete